MRLFTKIFLFILISFFVVIIFISIIVVKEQIYSFERDVIQNRTIIGSFMSKQIEVGYLESNWPLESLKKLSGYNGFLFWWIVRDDGIIHLADKASFMGTAAKEYFPEIASRQVQTLSLNNDKNYGIFFKPLHTGKNKWYFWYGFSLDEISNRKREIVTLIMSISISVLLVVSITLFIGIKRFTEPIKTLSEGASIIGGGDFSHRVKIESQDEIGELSRSFNKMAEDLLKSYTALNESQTNLQTMFNSLDDFLFVLDIECKIIQVNSIVLKRLGYIETELLGEHVLKVHPPDRHKETVAILADMLADKTESCPIPLMGKDGTQIPVETKIARGQWGNQEVFFCLSRDISERKLAEEERERIIKELQDALKKVKTLSGLLPICSHCNRIRDSKGGWNRLEAYIQKRTTAEFSHGVCPECAKKHYPDWDIYDD